MKRSEEPIERLNAFIKNPLKPVEEGYSEYDEWQIFHDPELLSIATEALYQKIVKAKIEFDYIGALGGSGTPLAISLMLKMLNNRIIKRFFFISDPLVGVSSRWLRITKPEVKVSRPSILFVDTEIKSGRTIWDGLKKIEEEDAQLKGVAVITDYKGFPDREDYNDIIVKGQIPVLRLFDFYPLENKLIRVT